MENGPRTLFYGNLNTTYSYKHNERVKNKDHNLEDSSPVCII